MIVICPECGRGVSEFADYCPNCGLPKNMFERARKTRSTNNIIAVDLGLPSKTLWSSCNVGAKSPYDIGIYFSWGDSNIKDIFNWENYKYFLGFIQSQGNTYPRLSKYVCHSRLGIIDNKSYIESIDDPTTSFVGYDWTIPSYEQQQELWRFCRIEKASIKGVTGFNIIGPNGNSIFFINSGYYTNNTLKDANKPIFWLNQANPFGYENATGFSVVESLGHYTFGTCAYLRCNGIVIRPVKK